MPDAPLLHRVPSLIGWLGSPSMWMTLPPRVDTTWPQPTPQKGQMVVVAVAPLVLSAGTAGAQPDWVNAPSATVPVVSPLRNCRRVGFGGLASASSAPSASTLFSCSSFIFCLESKLLAFSAPGAKAG